MDAKNNNACLWTYESVTPVAPVKPTDPTTPTNDVPLFTKEFCHPREIDEGKAEKEFGECLATNTKDTCGVTNSCVWGNGSALIPEGDFCAPEMLTDDVKTIESCIIQKTDTTCVAPCKWRKGTGADTQPPVVNPTQPQVGRCEHVTAPLAGTADICKPVTTKDACYNKDL